MRVFVLCSLCEFLSTGNDNPTPKSLSVRHSML
nr:MAG TPA: hypothetical protein [Microviridae sp.]